MGWIWLQPVMSTLTPHYTEQACASLSLGLLRKGFTNASGNSKPVEVPIAYDSFAFSATQKLYPTHKKELCAIFKFCVKHDYHLRVEVVMSPAPNAVKKKSACNEWQHIEL